MSTLLDPYFHFIFLFPLIPQTHTHTRTHTHTHIHTYTHKHTFPQCVAPGDYGTLINFHLGPFNNSVRQLSFNVSVVNDNIPENDEMFIASLTLDPADQARLGNRLTVSPDVATLTIQNNDGKLLATPPTVLLTHFLTNKMTPYYSC